MVGFPGMYFGRCLAKSRATTSYPLQTPKKPIFLYQARALLSTIKIELYVNNVIMSPITATLKCPHERGEDTHGAKGVTSVALVRMVEVGTEQDRNHPFLTSGA